MRPSTLRTMYDAIGSKAAGIPRDAQLVAGYVAPSSFAWTSVEWGLFPAAVHVTITPQVSGSGLVLDVEPGDAAAGQVPGWLARERAAGFWPSVYTSWSNWAAVQAAVNQANMVHPPYWIADYSQDSSMWWPELNAISAVAWQFTDNPAAGNPFDTSFVGPYWLGVDPAPIVHRGETMLIQGSAAKFNTQAMTDGVFKTNLDPVTAGADPVLFPRLVVSDELWDQLEANTNALLAQLHAGSGGTLSGTATVTVNLAPGVSGGNA